VKRAHRRAFRCVGACERPKPTVFEHTPSVPVFTTGPFAAPAGSRGSYPSNLSIRLAAMTSKPKAKCAATLTGPRADVPSAALLVQMAVDPLGRRAFVVTQRFRR